MPHPLRSNDCRAPDADTEVAFGKPAEFRGGKRRRSAGFYCFTCLCEAVLILTTSLPGRMGT
jgi:hypothetical protein